MDKSKFGFVKKVLQMGVPLGQSHLTHLTDREELGASEPAPRAGNSHPVAGRARPPHSNKSKLCHFRGSDQLQCAVGNFCTNAHRCSRNPSAEHFLNNCGQARELLPPGRPENKGNGLKNQWEVQKSKAKCSKMTPCTREIMTIRQK